jgi:methylmalonyl-CoA/ethylmalonyl-CoA epimerase
MNFNHIGVAVENIEMAIKIYTDLGYTIKDQKRYLDPIQKVNICFMQKCGHPLIELVSPQGSSSPINRILKLNGPTPYHTCYEVDSIDDEILILKTKGFIQITKPQKAIAFQGRLVSFLINRHIGLIELLQKNA